MSAVLAIAKRDIKGYLSAPKAAVIFCLMLFLMGGFFFMFIHALYSINQNPMAYGNEGVNLEQVFRAVFYNTHFLFLLIVPAVSMGAFADERKTQSIKLLLSAPISAVDILFGKFFALAGIMALALLCSAIYPIFALIYGNPDMGVIISSYLGLFLLLCAQLSYGLWVSSLTNNQLLAFLFTMFGLFALMILNWVAPNISMGGETMQSTLQYLAFNPHLDVFFKGLLTVSDTVYFLCFSGVFLFFTYLSIDSQRWR